MIRNWKLLVLALALIMPITLIGRYRHGGYYGYGYGPYWGYPGYYAPYYYGPGYGYYTNNPGIAVGATIGGLFGALASH